MNAKGPQVKVNKQTRPFSIFDRVSLRQIMGKPGIMCKQGGYFKFISMIEFFTIFVVFQPDFLFSTIT